MGAPTTRPGQLHDSRRLRPGPGTPAADPVSLPALHPDELAAHLEAEGLTDVLARQRYGAPNVFAYADHLFQSAAPTRSVLSEMAALPPLPFPWTGLLRGVVYALPGAAMALAVSLIAALPAGAPRGLSYALIAAVILAWGWGQGFAVVGYRLTGPAQRRFVQRATLLVLPLGALLGAALVNLLHPEATSYDVLGGALVTALTAGALSASSALLVLRLVPLAMLAYAPACAALLAQAAGHPFPPDLAWGAVVYAAALPIVGLMLPARGSPGPLLPRPSRSVVVSHALAAWACAGFVALTWGLAPGAPGWAQGSFPLLLPVILSLGVMEVLTELTFRGLRRHAAQFHSMTAVHRRASWTALKAVMAYSGVLLTLLLLSVSLTRPETLYQPGTLPLLLLPALLYGAALMLGTLSASVGEAWWTLTAWVLGVAVLLSPVAALPYGAVLAASVPMGVLVVGVHRALKHPLTYL